MKTLAIYSDGHTNSYVGLAKPERLRLDNGDIVSAGEVRRFIFHTFEDILEQVDKRKRGDLYSVLNGDAGEGDYKGRTTTIISRDAAQIQKYMNDVYAPIFQMSKGVWVVRGTEAHVGCNGALEESLAANFRNTIKDKNTDSWQALFLNIDGVTMDIMHHPKGSGTSRPMNSQGLVDRLASDALFEYANAGDAPPQLVVRSHLHGYKDSHNAFRTRAIITPPLSLLTPYNYRSGINHENALGCILIHCENGQYEVEPIIMKARKQTWQVVK